MERGRQNGDLRLTLDRPPRGGRPAGRSTIVLLIVAIAIGAANLAIVLRGGNGPAAGLREDEARDLALRLEKRGLNERAAAAWIEYLGVARPGRESAARIWYRIGTLREEAGDCQGALDAFYRSEAWARLPELEPEIGRRVAACLERRGSFAALRRELEERTAATPADGEAGETIVAEIGDWKIRRADLDRMIEAEIEAQIESAAGGLPAEAREARKKEMLDAAIAGGRAAWLERFVAEELLWRRAREEGLADDPTVAALRRNLDRKLLAGRYLDRAYGEIEVTPEEARRWFDAHAGELAGEDGAVPSFEEAAGRAGAAVRAEKEADVARRTIEELMRRYGAVIHREALGE
ncbi:MAG TPA: hypothetical protein ENO23_10860 [Alphaproteobacteria bacterium]|nr:hypothetical protein [Alphaproteobacteria bacterium]